MKQFQENIKVDQEDKKLKKITMQELMDLEPKVPKNKDKPEGGLASCVYLEVTLMRPGFHTRESLIKYLTEEAGSPEDAKDEEHIQRSTKTVDNFIKKGFLVPDNGGKLVPTFEIEKMSM